MPSVHRFGGKYGERAPDETEGNQMIVGKWFVVEKNAEQKTARRREVLQESDCRHPKMSCGVTEPDERQTGHDARADEQECKGPGHWTENQSASVW